MGKTEALVECQVVSYQTIFGKRAIAGLKGEANIAFHKMLHPKSIVQEYCFSDLLESRVRYWKEILRIDA